MDGPSKNIQWWWSNGFKTIEKQSKYSGLNKFNSIAYIFYKFGLVFDQNHVREKPQMITFSQKSSIYFPEKVSVSQMM